MVNIIDSDFDQLYGQMRNLSSEYNIYRLVEIGEYYRSSLNVSNFRNYFERVLYIVPIIHSAF